jgi:hypothetical protein
MASYEGGLLLARDFSSNVTGPIDLKHGLISASHTSNLTAGWTPGTLPSPFPIVIASSIVSLVLAFIGWKTAMSTWVSPEKRRVAPVRPEGFETWTFRQKWAWARRHGAETWNPAVTENEAELQNYAALHSQDEVHPAAGQMPFKLTSSNQKYAPVSTEMDALPAYTPAISHQPAREPILKWQDNLMNKIAVLVSVTYNTLRAVFAAISAIQIASTHHGTHAAVSSLFLLYLSIQTFMSNRKIPRIITLLLVIDLTLVGIAFVLSTWDWKAHAYGDAVIMGGNCPQLPSYAPDCRTQLSQWSMVGCGSTVGPRKKPASSSSHKTLSPNPNYGATFYPPYVSAGDINSGNKLQTIEAVMGALGTFWVAVTLVITIYEAIRTFFTAESLVHLLWPIPFDEKFATNKKTGKTRTHLGWAALSLLAFFALGGAFIVTILSIVGHVVGETHNYSATYIDSFGPEATLNFTHPPMSGGSSVTGNLTSPIGGNASSWTDCFTVILPRSPNGFFDEWLEHNTLAAFRLISLL